MVKKAVNLVFIIFSMGIFAFCFKFEFIERRSLVVIIATSMLINYIALKKKSR